MGPPLSVPAPPPRVLAPVEEEPLADNPPPPEQAAPQPRPAAPRPATPRPRPPTTAVTTPTEPEPKAEQPVVPPPVTEPPPRPAPTQADAAAERKVRDVLRRAASDLGRVNYQKLSVDGKAQYDASKRFTDQAELALKDRNYAFANTVADKAAAIATELLGSR